MKGVLQERVKTARQPPRDAIAYINKALDKRGLTVFDPKNSHARNRAVSLTVDVGLEQFFQDASERQRLVELSVFPEDVDIPLNVVATLWQATGGLDEFDAEDLCGRLHRYSLLQTLNLETRHIRLHDVMRTYLQTALASRSPAESIHRALLDVWADPYKLPDGYPWRWFAYHMVAAGRQSELRELLLSPEWLHTKLANGDVTSLTADFDYLRNDEELQLVQGAVRLSSTSSPMIPLNLPPRWWGGFCPTRRSRRLRNSPTERLRALKRRGFGRCGRRCIRRERHWCAISSAMPLPSMRWQ